MRARWPFVGRHEELDLIGGAIKRPSGAGYVLAGRAGVGKTRLLWEIVRAIDPAQCMVKTLVGTEATSAIPFGALASLLPAELPKGSSPTNMLRFAADALGCDSGGRRLVIGVDDAHVLDDTSAAVLHQLALADKAFVLASVRTGEPAPGSITALWKDELVERLEVQAISRTELTNILGSALGGDVDNATVTRLWDVTQGNILFLRELVNAGVDSGALTELEGVWHWDGAWVMAPRLSELLGQRIGRLADDELELMELVAYGAPIGLEPLRTLIADGTLQAAEAKNLLWVRKTADLDVVHLAHPLYGEVLRSSCPPLRARSRQLELADALERTGAGREDDWLRIAIWRLDGGAPVRADLLTRALRQAWARFDLNLTDRLARKAIEAGSGVEAIRILWRALLMAQRNDEVEQLLSQWMLAPMADEDRIDLILGRAQNLFWGKDDTERGLAVLREAESLTSDVESRELIVALRGLLNAFAGDPLACLEAIGMLTEGPPIRSAKARAIANIAENVISAMQGLLRIGDLPALDDLREAVRPWEDEPPFLGAVVDVCRFTALIDHGDILGALRLAARAQADAEEHNYDFAAYLMRVCHAQAQRCHGRPATARRILREGLGRYRRDTSVAYQVPALLFAELTLAEALCGRAEEAASAFEEAGSSMRASTAVFSPTVQIGALWVASAGGDQRAAIAIALELAAAIQELGGMATESVIRHDVVRLGGASRVADRLAELAELLDTPLARLMSDHARAAASFDAEGLDKVGEGFERSGSELLAAEAFAQASISYEKIGRQASARAARTKAALLLDRCEGARTPAVEAIRAPELTPRERDVAHLAATGLSSKEIAERLTLSKRTVDNHLHQVYAKLGIAGREQLGRFLSDR